MRLFRSAFTAFSMIECYIIITQLPIGDASQSWTPLSSQMPTISTSSRWVMKPSRVQSIHHEHPQHPDLMSRIRLCQSGLFFSSCNECLVPPWS